jgi:hypothetical protein
MNLVIMRVASVTFETDDISLDGVAEMIIFSHTARPYTASEMGKLLWLIWLLGEMLQGIDN